jgi:hypothetical protein
MFPYQSSAHRTPANSLQEGSGPTWAKIVQNTRPQEDRAASLHMDKDSPQFSQSEVTGNKDRHLHGPNMRAPQTPKP